MALVGGRRAWPSPARRGLEPRRGPARRLPQNVRCGSTATPHQVEPLPFDGLDGVGDLRFTALATRAKRENYLVIASDYEQPFGTFTGTLPVAGALARAGA